MGERDKGYQACDIAFEHFQSAHGTFILLIKAIIILIAGEHRDAISRVDDLIAIVHFNSICYVVQACARPAKTSPLKFAVGIYVSSHWKLAYGEE
ncbi:hypothetical protein OG21DRAFT_963279 [Imleria badia]|nr:hypothetical protein OG21DRAFT_963279 [Imleria badia]